MATDVERLVLQMSADVRALERSMQRAQRSADNSMTAIERRAQRMNQTLERTFAALGGAASRFVAPLAAAFAGREVLQMIDNWTNLTNALRQYTDVLGSVEQAQSRITDVALGTGVSLQTLQDVLGGVARAGRESGAGADEIFRSMETIAKAAVLGGASIQAMDGALRQLGQALASPRVQMEEFNSLIDGAPVLAQAFADGIDKAGGSLQRLRQLIKEGEVSGRDLAEALASQAATIDERFGQMEITVGRALQNVMTAITALIGTFVQASGGSQTLGQSINNLATQLDALRDKLDSPEYDAYIEFAQRAIAATRLLAGVVIDLTQIIFNLGRAIAALAEGAGAIVVGDWNKAAQAGQRMVGAMDNTFAQMRQIGGRFATEWKNITGAIDSEARRAQKRARDLAAASSGGGGRRPSIAAAASGNTAAADRERRARERAAEMAEREAQAEARAAAERANNLALLRLQNQLDIARAQNNERLTAELEDQLSVSENLARLLDLGVPVKEAWEEAVKFTAALREAEEASKALNRQMQNLEFLAEEARLSGDKRAELIAEREIRIRRLMESGLGRSSAEMQVKALESADLKGKFKEWFTEGARAATEGEMGDFFEKMLSRAFEKAANNAADAIFELLKTIGGTGGSGGGTNWLKLFVDAFGGLQHGGFMSAGQSRVVGERGPELFTAKTSGYIIPNAAGRAVVVNANDYRTINFTGTSGELAQLQRALAADRATRVSQTRAIVGDMISRNRLG